MTATPELTAVVVQAAVSYHAESATFGLGLIATEAGAAVARRYLFLTDLEGAAGIMAAIGASALGADRDTRIELLARMGQLLDDLVGDEVEDGSPGPGREDPGAEGTAAGEGAVLRG